MHVRTFEAKKRPTKIQNAYWIAPLQFVISGSTDGRIHIWNAENGTKVCVPHGDHTGPVQCVQFNPKYMLMASACKNMAFWLPSVEEDA